MDLAVQAPDSRVKVNLNVNGVQHTLRVEPRQLLVQAMRTELGITSVNIGCESGRCGACTVEIDGRLAKSCTLLAVQVDGARVNTVSGMGKDAIVTQLQDSFHAKHGLQCGFCTPGMIVAASALLRHNPRPDENAVRQALRGNLCRCTGYQHIVEAVLDAAQKLEGAV